MRSMVAANIRTLVTNTVGTGHRPVAFNLEIKQNGMVLVALWLC